MTSAAATPYQLKDSPYSSHSLLLASLPSSGDGRRVLDVGCAGGYLGAILASRGYRVAGVDSPGSASAGFPDAIELLEADLDLGLPPLTGRFDFVICADVLEHLRRPEFLLRELRAVLAPGGRLACSLPNSGHAYFRWNILAGRFPAEDRGLFDRTLRCSGVPIGLALPKWEGSAAVRALERMSYESARWWKTLFAYQFIVTAVPEIEP
jgi:SAM-dependent methyltransferase